jgi:hypothetical protein
VSSIKVLVAALCYDCYALIILLLKYLFTTAGLLVSKFSLFVIKKTVLAHHGLAPAISHFKTVYNQ